MLPASWRTTQQRPALCLHLPPMIAAVLSGTRELSNVMVLAVAAAPCPPRRCHRITPERVEEVATHDRFWPHFGFRRPPVEVRAQELTNGRSLAQGELAAQFGHAVEEILAEERPDVLREPRVTLTHIGGRGGTSVQRQHRWRRCFSAAERKEFDVRLPVRKFRPRVILSGDPLEDKLQLACTLAIDSCMNLLLRQHLPHTSMPMCALPSLSR